MNTTIIPSSQIRKTGNYTWLESVAKKGVIKRLHNINKGKLTIIDGDHTFTFGQTDVNDNLDISITVHHPAFYAAIAFGGSVGAGESYFHNEWSCSDVTGLVRLLLKNRNVLDAMDGHLARLQVPLFKAFHWFNRNTKEGSKKNISAHYDLGNDFFRLFLDENMMYSSAIYPSDSSTLEEASTYKLDLICRKLHLTPDHHVLEIGTGWGGFAMHAAKHYGCRVTTTTISREQYELARRRVSDAGLQEKIEVLLKDYRDLDGKFDRIVSIEMIEAIGHHYLGTYFKKCGTLLKPNGSMLLQAITIADQRYIEALKEVDFIKRFIFPGCFIPSITAMQNAITRQTDLKITHLEDIGPDYARTLNEWRVRFFEKIAEVKRLGYPEQFIRMWEFYLCYCEGGFMERVIGDVQLVLSKPENRDPLRTF